MWILWAKFLICAAVVVFCGNKICVYAEKIARWTNLGHGFVGFILLAVVTSLPELSVAVSATRIGALDLAIGDLFGSNLFNLAVIGLILLSFIKEPKLLDVPPTHFLSASFSILLVTFAAMGIIFYRFVTPYIGYAHFFLDVESALIVLGYVIGAYLLYANEKARTAGFLESISGEGRKIGRVWAGFLIYSVILVLAAIYLSRLGDSIARIPVKGIALGGTFVGGLFIAITTSLPEVTVAVSAMKLGSLDMALGNIFGSNMFNMLIIPIADICLGRKVILSNVSSIHLFTALFVIILTGMVIASLAYRSKRKVPALALDTTAILFTYFTAIIISFYFR